MIDLTGKVALVTGASRGIGAAIADKLAAAGATVVGTATSAQGAEAISQRLNDHNGKGLVLDVSDPDSITQALQQMKESVGMPDILVNNAGITRDNLLMRMKDDEWQQVLDTDLTAVFRLSKACLRPMMKKRQGRIISIGSVIGAMGNPGQANYAAAKAGLVGFSKSLAREIGSRGITVNVVAPGYIVTDMTRDLPEEQQLKLQSQVPLQRLGDPADIANAVLFLASPMGDYITGETLHVNGGMHMA
jgi:3-oxoacyl-(acyl-carrier-protein) reductase